MALALARLGAHVIINDLPGDGAHGMLETRTTIEAMGGLCDVAPCDVADAEAVDRMVSSVGELDIIIANAAWSDRSGSIDEQDMSLLRRTVEVSQMGVVHVVRSGVRALKSRVPRPDAATAGVAPGKVVIVSSIMGVQPLSDHAAAYSMAKAAVAHLGRCLAAELVPHRVNVNVVLPGWIDTPGERKWSSDARIEECGSKMPWGRLGTPDDVGAAAAFLCTDAADYVTGSTLVVDGGYSVSVRLPMGAST